MTGIELEFHAHSMHEHETKPFVTVTIKLPDQAIASTNIKPFVNVSDM
jgi:hypothetical protein